MKELTGEASSEGSKRSLPDYFKERPNYSGHKTGQKLQTTVRFEADILQDIEKVSERHGFSLAEAVRKLVRKGLRRAEV